MSEATPITAMDLPQGEYAIVEVLGHRTLVGRVSEVERFGTKMLQVEPLFGDVMLAPVLLGGGSLYQFTPCSAETAYARRPTRTYQLPGSVAATIPPLALPNNNEMPSFLVDDDAARDWYMDLWNTLHTAPGQRWEDSPWIVAVSFAVHKGNVDEVRHV